MIIITPLIIIGLVIHFCNTKLTPPVKFLNDFSLIKYNGTKKYSTKLAANDSLILTLNYEVGHSSFYASSSILELLNIDKLLFKKKVNQKVAYYIFQETSKKHNLKNIDLNTVFNSTNRNIDYNGNKYKISCGLNGVYLSIKGKNNTKKRIFENAPNAFIHLGDIIGDSKPELLALIQYPDYWDCKYFVCQLYQINN